MAQRDYVGRGQSSARRKKTTKGKGKKAASGLPLTTLIVAIALVALFVGGLYFITHNKKEVVEPTSSSAGQQPTNNLPPKPQERWQYIKELENRQVGNPLQPPATSSGSQINPKATLSPEQLRFLQQIEADKRQPAVELPEVPYNGEVPRSQVVITPPTTTAPSVQPSQPSAPLKQEPAPAITTPKPATTEARFLVQCGSFKTNEQAESVRATLAFSGIESRVTKGNDGWIRVLSGPFNKEQANTLSRQAAGAGVSGCILRTAGG
ncbi:TPA: SPOR domain-containing protein [Proteus mirabilis]|uniref:SPOR domain-containing protein n=1 Tax=Proteus mirabilis TaxID=584 RepID=UPI0013D65DE7|nr:SPOR domain-containing protein [Proteus mirabilis]MBG2848515.1 SPOR domain-containing protein [Proteus mirabilis]MBG3123444.1 SPOR domain-containing protein [Proteus mirabilis]MBG5978167.1 SPOR domain-containing protein [Proteus mirabilis]MBI6251686.1 SPOR domain-containing protein [Proteus mirabilis]MBI6288962.1 SPOR domain-containing protein [Proteus mirabilis]